VGKGEMGWVKWGDDGVEEEWVMGEGVERRGEFCPPTFKELPLPMEK